ncbi:MAG: STAS domain-containing protein [Myxococcota bacterium]
MLTAELTDGGETCVLALQGSLDGLTVAELQKEVEGRLGGSIRQLVLDMSRLEFIDSSGVGAVVAAFKKTRAHRQGFLVRNLRGQPLEIFRLLRLDRAFVIDSGSGEDDAP